MSQKVKFFYFNSGESIRLILSHAKVPFEDVRFEWTKQDEWQQFKESTPWGQLPVLEEDGIQISQSKAIARYLANKHGLVGDTEWEAAKCDEYVESVDDLKLELFKWFFEKDEAKKEQILKELEATTVPKYLSKFEALLQKNGNGFIVGKKLTYADIFVANFMDGVVSKLKETKLDTYPYLKKHHEFVLNQPGIKEWIEKRPPSM